MWVRAHCGDRHQHQHPAQVEHELRVLGAGVLRVRAVGCERIEEPLPKPPTPLLGHGSRTVQIQHETGVLGSGRRGAGRYGLRCRHYNGTAC